jgi:hypothetical protein
MVHALSLAPFGSNQIRGGTGLLKSLSGPGHLDLLESIRDQNGNTPPVQFVAHTL